MIPHIHDQGRNSVQKVSSVCPDPCPPLRVLAQERDRCRPVLDLERDIGDRNPPGPTVRVTSYKKTGNGKVSTHHGTKEVGKAVLWSHKLEAYGCQCRHDLDTEARIERGVSGNNERSGKCPLTMKLTPGEIASFGQPLSRLSLSGR